MQYVDDRNFSDKTAFLLLPLIRINFYVLVYTYIVFEYASAEVIETYAHSPAATPRQVHFYEAPTLHELITTVVKKTLFLSYSFSFSCSLHENAATSV